MNIDLYTKNTPNKGRGIFALKPFKKGDIVLDWNEENKDISKEDLNKLPEDEKKYVAQFNEKIILIAPPGRYINHSCNPNIKNENGKDYAIRDIEKDEEITGDYEDGGTGLSFECKCGALNCRKIIKGFIK